MTPPGRGWSDAINKLHPVTKSQMVWSRDTTMARQYITENNHDKITGNKMSTHKVDEGGNIKS